MAQQKKWVFTELVEDSDNPEHLIAYAMYKADKDDQATQCRARQMTPEQVDQALQTYHDSIAHSARQLDDYRAKAHRVVEQLIIRVSDEIENTFEERIEAMEAAHAAELNAQWKKWGEQAATYSAHLTKPHWFKRFCYGFFTWIGGGVSGLLATVVTTLIIVMVFSITSPNIRDIARNSLKNAVDTVIPATPMPDVTDAVGSDKSPKPQ